MSERGPSRRGRPSTTGAGSRRYPVRNRMSRLVRNCTTPPGIHPPSEKISFVESDRFLKSNIEVHFISAPSPLTREDSRWSLASQPSLDEDDREESNHEQSISQFESRFRVLSTIKEGSGHNSVSLHAGIEDACAALLPRPDHVAEWADCATRKKTFLSRVANAAIFMTDPRGSMLPTLEEKRFRA